MNGQKQGKKGIIGDKTQNKQTTIDELSDTPLAPATPRTRGKYHQGEKLACKMRGEQSTQRTHARTLATTARSPDGRCSITARPRLRASKGQLQCKLLTTRAPRCFVLSARCHTQSDMNYLQLYQTVQLRCLEKEYIYSFMQCDQLYKCFIKFHTRYFGELTIWLLSSIQ